jgi:hypothetical protein
MTGRAKTWNALSRAGRYILLRTARPGGSAEVIMYESKLQWRALVPSTQIELSELPSWAVILDQNAHAQ